jgi:hypothetical protein
VEMVLLWEKGSVCVCVCVCVWRRGDEDLRMRMCEEGVVGRRAFEDEVMHMQV